MGGGLQLNSRIEANVANENLTLNPKIDKKLNVKKNLNVSSEKKLNLTAKQDYHIQGLHQAKLSFKFSLISAIIGFCVIIYSAFIIQENGNIGIIAGVIIETVSALFFYMYKNSNKMMIDFFEKLRKDANTITAVDLTKSIANESIQDELKVKLALHLIGISEENICKNIRDITRCECTLDGAEKNISS